VVTEHVGLDLQRVLTSKCAPAADHALVADLAARFSVERVVSSTTMPVLAGLQFLHRRAAAYSAMTLLLAFSSS
jgi:hypothetical protein